MRTCRHLLHLLTLAALVVFCGGCDHNPLSGMFGTEEPSTDAIVEEPSIASAARGASTTRLRQRIGELFGNVLPTLEDSRELVDRHAELPDSSYIPFRADKESNTAAIDNLLDEAIEILGVSEVSDYRQRIRDSNASISLSRRRLADYRQKRVSASWSKDQGRLDKVNPYNLSKEEIDAAIVVETANIKDQQERLVSLKESFRKELNDIGVDVNEDGIDSLLSSVSGDDIVTMAVVFDNIKHVTSQLQQLTEQSGEALDVSKRYYGMYVVMIRVMDRIQRTFVLEINERHIPRLAEFNSKAARNIKKARALIESDGGDSKLLEANIASNQLTRETATLYIDYLKQNAELISADNKRVQRNLATAMNTYDTVKLSSDVAELMKSGRRDFDTLMKLQIPPLREFSNSAMRKEFDRMTSELRTGS